MARPKKQSPTELKSLSLVDLDHKTPSGIPFEFEYITVKGESSGVFIQVIGRESELFSRRSSVIEKDYIIARKNMTEKEFDESPEGSERFTRLVAARIVGWRGVQEEYTEARAVKLCGSNNHLTAQVLVKSNHLANFTKV